MKRQRLGILIVGLLTIGTASAFAQASAPAITDLARGKITGPINIDVKDASSDVVMNRVVYDAAGVGGTWHSHPLHYVTVKAGSMTIYRPGADGACTSKTYTAGQSYEEPAGTHIHEGSPDVELLVLYVGVPVGGAVAKDEAAPTGQNCPAKLNGGLKRTELARGTVQGAYQASATGDSEMLMQLVTIPPGASLRGWYSSPAALFAAQKAGSITVYTGDATSCTAKTSTAGQGRFVAANQAIFVRNEGSVPSEVYATRLALPVGAAPRVDAKNPGGANCPDVAAAATPSPATDLPRTGGPEALMMLGLGLTAAGTVVAGLSRRR